MVCAFGSWDTALCCLITKGCTGASSLFLISSNSYTISGDEWFSLHPFSMLFMVLQTSADNVPLIISTPSWRILTYIGSSWKPFHVSSLDVKGLRELLEDPSMQHFLYHFYPDWLAPLEGSNRIVRHDFLLWKLQWLFPSLSCLALSWIILFVMVSTALVQKLLTALCFLQTFFLGLMVYLLSAMSLAPAGYKWKTYSTSKWYYHSLVFEFL